MQDPNEIDFSKLVGFDQVVTEATRGVDFQGDVFAARVGAKRGGEAAAAPDDRDVDFAKLVGFAQLANDGRREVDFQDDAFGARIGAKRGGEATVVPTEPSEDRD